MTSPKQPTERMTVAYAEGRELSHLGLDAAARESVDRGIVNHESDLQAACWLAGYRGEPMPRWVSGWRFGSIPECGKSRNHRDDCPESGVSLMAIDGESDGTDGTFELFNGGRPRVAVAGWLLARRGSDGEPLVLGAVAL